MIFDLKSIHKNIEIVNKNYIEKFKRIDLSILGMGTDGHTTLYFPTTHVTKFNGQLQNWCIQY